VKTAVDTNVFVALFSGDADTSAVAQASLETARAGGPLEISPAVYAELVAGRDEAFVEKFLSEKDIEVDWEQSREVWSTAGARYREYARDRRKQKGDPGPRRILADSLISAHAIHRAEILLTSDSRIYRTYFSELKVMGPTESPL
jgi:predicted nucleic acid-binding protein